MKYSILVLLNFVCLANAMQPKSMRARNNYNYNTDADLDRLRIKNFINERSKYIESVLYVFKNLMFLEKNNLMEYLDFINFSRKTLREKFYQHKLKDPEKDAEWEKYKKIMEIIDELSFIDDYNEPINLCLNFLNY